MLSLKVKIYHFHRVFDLVIKCNYLSNEMHINTG